MEKFLTKKKDSHTALKTKVHDCLQSYIYPGGALHVDNGLLFCTTCNTVLDHTRKSTIEKHFKSATQLQRSNSANSKATGKQQNLNKLSLNVKTIAQVHFQTNISYFKTSLIFDRQKIVITFIYSYGSTASQ